MFVLECELVESLLRPVVEPPVLSVVIPTFRRPQELTEAVVSIADQVDAGLAGKAGLEPGLFERISGRRRDLEQTPARPLTFVDNIIENLWRCLAIGTPIEADYWDMLEQFSSQWRPDHAEQLKTVHEISVSVEAALKHHQALVADHRQRAAAGPRTQEELDLLERIAAAVTALETDVNDARKTAFAMAGQLNG